MFDSQGLVLDAIAPNSEKANVILAIESSCDESALALFDPQSGFKGEWVHTQIDLHQKYGGVVPDLASREHLRNFPLMLPELLKKLGNDRPEHIAVTCGPGLAGSLALGIALAKSLALCWDLPLCGVNHLRGHAFSPFIPLFENSPKSFRKELEAVLPHLGLIVSGGNTLLFTIDQNLGISILGSTVDDAAGEALDKGAKLMGMPYPGGPLVEKYATEGDPKRYDFPRAFAGNSELKFSFSGLKTSLRYLLEKMDDQTLERERDHLCASYQDAIVSALELKCRQALKKHSHIKSIGLSGGVANNKTLRTRLNQLAHKHRISLLAAHPRHTGDNAGMIAFAAWLNPQGVLKEAPLTFRPTWTLA